jgi:Protein of unknown function (DUF1403)
LFVWTVDKAPPPIHHAHVIRADLHLVSESVVDPGDGVGALPPNSTKAKRTSTKAPERQAFPPPAPIPSWARASGRADGDPLFAAGAALALLDAHLRRDPPAAGALRQRLGLISAGSCAKLLRLNTHEGALRDLHFAIGDAGPAARILHLWRDLAARPPSLDPGRLAAAAAALDLAVDPSGLSSSLKVCAGQGDPVSAAAKSAALVASAFPDAPAADAEILALWTFDLVLALRLRWPRPMPLIAAKILDPALRPPHGGRRPRPCEPAWEKHAVAAIALAAASALDLAGDLSRHANTLLAIAPKLRAKPAQRIVDLLLAEDCVSPAEAACRAPMTDRAARRLFDRLVALGAVREFSGRPSFRLYGL